jgi:hypothetical protein
MNWIQKHLKIILAVLTFVGLLILGLALNKRGQKVIEVPAPPDLKNEIRAIKAEADVQKLKATLGAEQARAKVEADHAETLQKLDEKQKKQADELKQDPAKLAAFLVRAGKAKS